MAVVELTDVGAPEPPVGAGGGRRSRARVAVVALGLVAVMITAGAWWFRGGTFLRASGAGYGGVVHPDEQLSFGIDLTTVSGPSVVLDSVSASRTDGAQVSWAVYRNAPGALGFGSVHGPLGPEWPTSPVHGYRVAQADGHPERGGTWLVATVTASRPGVYRLSGITIKYHSAHRLRQSASGTSICALVVPPAREQRLMQQDENFRPGVTDLSSVDPLVAEFETCTDPQLTN